MGLSVVPAAVTIDPASTYQGPPRPAHDLLGVPVSRLHREVSSPETLEGRRRAVAMLCLS